MNDPKYNCIRPECHHDVKSFDYYRGSQSPEEFFITKGELLYDVGSAPAGTYGYEPVFAEHFIAGTEVLTEMYFSGRGSVTYFDEEKNIDWILDSEWLHKLNLGEVELDVSPKS